MNFNFGQISADRTISSILEPSALFDALPGKAQGYGYLRAVQKSVLDSWSERRTQRDLVIKTNTGGGKTIAGLLILQASLHDGLPNALYLAPDPHLAGRVMIEAGRLGLSVVEDPQSGKFLSGDAICVTTMQRLVNGKSKFGLATPGGSQPVKVGALIVDDAHAALTLTQQNTTLRIPSTHEAYGTLLKMFTDDLEQQNRNALLDIKDNDYNAVLRIPFWAWNKQQSQVHAVLHPHRHGPDFEWQWPLISDLLPVCQAVITADGIEITPPCPPIEKFPSFHEATRRIYLTATLADDSVLVTHFDADPKCIAAPIVPDSAADLGDRLILAPQELNPSISHDDLRHAAKTLADNHNVVVLVPSLAKAALWSTEADRTVSKAADISDAVAALTQGHVGLVVVVNRYDGIDLPDDACRVLVIDGLPQAYSGTERREAVALRDSEAMVTRQLQRLEQGMGRGVRSREDRCAVLLFDPRLTELVARADIAQRLSPPTQAQLALSRKVAARLDGAPMTAVIDVITQVINDDPNFRRLSREALIDVTYGLANLSPTALPLRLAHNAAAAGRHQDAAGYAGEAVKAAIQSGDPRLAGWLAETRATYIDRVDGVKAQEVLSNGISLNAAILRPVAGLAYQKVDPGGGQGLQASQFLTAQYSKGSELVLGIESLLMDLSWDPSQTDDAEVALAHLGEHIGFVTQRPEAEYGRGPDALWALGNHKYAVLEAKTGATASMIWKKDINQLSGSVHWCKTEYGSDASVVPVMVHPRAVVERTGTPPSGCRILNANSLNELKSALRAYAAALAINDEFSDPGKVAGQLRNHNLVAESFMETYTVIASCQTN